MNYIDFWIIFCDVSFECVLASIFRRFLGSPTLENQQKPLFFQWFLLIFIKLTFAKKYRKILNFGFIFGGRNGENLVKNGMRKYCFVQHQILSIFFRIFAKIVRFGEGLGLQKIAKNHKKSCSGRAWNPFEIKSDFGSDFRRILVGFLKILDGFGKEFFNFLGRSSNDYKHLKL